MVGERYKEAIVHNTVFPLVELGQICCTTSGGTPTSTNEEYYLNGTIPWLTSGEVANGYIYKTKNFITDLGLQKSSAKLFPVNTVLVAMYGATAGQVGLLKIKSTTNQAVCGILPNSKFIPEFLYLTLKSKKDYMISLCSGGAQPNISQSIVKKINIPLPSLSIQQQIVAEIEGYQKIIDGARQVVENYKPAIKIEPEWEMVELGEVCTLIDYRGKTPKKSQSGIRLITAKNIRQGFINIDPEEFLENEEFERWSTRGEIKKNDVLITTEAPLGYLAINNFNETIAIAQRIIALRTKNQYLQQKYLLYILLSDYVQGLITDKKSGTTVYGIKSSELVKIRIPIPPVEVQTLIINQIDEEITIVNQNKRLIEIFEQKIKDKISEVWGE